MSIVRSLLWGSEGNYHVLGIPVELKKIALDEEKHLNLINRCIHNEFFRIITQSYTHVFVHEMSHAITRKLLFDGNSSIVIQINSNTLSGKILGCYEDDDWGQTAICLAGPLGDTIFSCFKLALAILVNKYISRPVAYLIGSGAIFWPFFELYVAIKNRGDFEKISSYSTSHYIFAMAILISSCVCGVFQSIRLHSYLHAKS